MSGLTTYQSKIDAGKALELRSKGLSYAEVGRLLGVSAQAIHQRLERFKMLLDNNVNEAYESNKDKILTGAMSKLIDTALDEEKLNNSSTLQCVTSFGILYDKQRLHRGQSTENVEYYSLSGQQAKIEDELSKIRQSLGVPLQVVSDEVIHTEDQSYDVGD